MFQAVEAKTLEESEYTEEIKKAVSELEKSLAEKRHQQIMDMIPVLTLYYFA